MVQARHETEVATILGQPSYLLRTSSVELAITQLGAMIGPVTFEPASRNVQPYAIAPWALEAPFAGHDPFMHALRGDFMCSSFGDNEEPFEGRRIPAHGDSVHATWTPLHSMSSERGVSLRVACALPSQGGRCELTTALVANQTLVYQRHDFSGIEGPINPGHHAMLKFPSRKGAGIVSFSPFVFAQTAIDAFSDGSMRSSLADGAVISDLRSVACRDGSRTDLTRFPARDGCDDAAIVCADPSLPFAWSAVTFSEPGYVWFSLRNPRLLPSTLLWFSNGGGMAPPWNARHRGVLGLEDVIAYFGRGLAASAADNDLNARGIPTALWLDRDTALRIPYIQGVAWIPRNFDRVTAIETLDPQRLRIRSASGCEVTVECFIGFLDSGLLEGLCDA